MSLLILKSIYNLSDEKLVEEHWEMNVYFQYFSGEMYQKWRQLCAVSDLVYFRKRIGEDDIRKIFKHSIDQHGSDILDPNVSIDTTVQEKNITYPTDLKLQKKIIDKCVKMAKAPLRRDSEHQKCKKRKHFRKRAVIEPINWSRKTRS